MMSPCPAWRASSSTRCHQTQRTDQASTSFGNHGASGTGTARWAVGTIRYSAIEPAADGIIVYLKPALTGDEPIDVVNYARSHPAFPQESTMNQWFDTAQFESYRTLGLHTVQSLCRTHPAGSVKDLCIALVPGAVTV